MKESLKTSLIILLYLLVLFKGVKELLWVEREKHNLDHNLELTINYDDSLFSLFTDEPKVEKRIFVHNNETDQELRLTFVSTDWNLHFYLTSETGGTILHIVDQEIGENSYHYDDLTLLAGGKNCLGMNNEEDFCQGMNENDLLELGNPIWIYRSE